MTQETRGRTDLVLLRFEHRKQNVIDAIADEHEDIRALIAEGSRLRGIIAGVRSRCMIKRDLAAETGRHVDAEEWGRMVALIDEDLANA